MIIREIEQKTPILYVDMDGVLADFYTPFNKMAGVNSWKDADKATISQALQQITQMNDFWINLDVLSDVPKLLQAIKEVTGGPYNILSKALASDPNAVAQKKQWTAKLSLRPDETIIMPATGNKGKYAKQSNGTQNILIDDFGYNITQWQQAGGIGIQHKNGEVNTTINNLKKAFKKYEI
jgi:hypothetical protein